MQGEPALSPARLLAGSTPSVLRTAAEDRSPKRCSRSLPPPAPEILRRSSVVLSWLPPFQKIEHLLCAHFKVTEPLGLTGIQTEVRHVLSIELRGLRQRVQSDPSTKSFCTAELDRRFEQPNANTQQ